ncbi:MAG: Nramp family divalent metal transporter [Cyclobacteriaceae bacterium]
MPNETSNHDLEKKTFWQSLGPGIITAALVFGPGSLTINTKLGATYGYSLLWVLILAMVFMIAFTGMSTRIGLFGDRSLIQQIKARFGKPVTVIIGLGVFLVTASFQAGNTVGASLAFSELFSSPLVLWISFFTVIAISLLFFGSFYKILEKLMIALVLVMLASFLLTIIMASPNLLEIIKGVVPSIPTGSEFLIITLTASSFSIVGAFYQSYLVGEKKWTINQKQRSIRESTMGIVILGLLSTMVMLCASAVLHVEGIVVKSASDLGLALEPLFGAFTSNVFMIGFFAASFSSMIGNATIGGVILADTFFSESRLNSMKVRPMVMLVIVIGAIVAYIFGALPLQLIIFAQGITVILVPLIALILLYFANSKNLPKELMNSGAVNVIGVLGILVLLFMSAYTIQYLLF